MDLSIIKMNMDHYWIKREGVVNKILFQGRTFYNKFERVNAKLSQTVIKQHTAGEIVAAHSLIDKHKKVQNIVIDYNGKNPERFYHRTRQLLLKENFENFTAYKTKTEGHLHIYIHINNSKLQEAIQIGKKISMKLAEKQPKEWRVFPNINIPNEYNILILPYEIYALEPDVS